METGGRSGRFWWVWLGLLCAYGFFHSLAYALSNPVFESPDEPGHLDYINRIASGGGLPNQYDPAQFLAEGHQHPLYYMTLGLALRITGGRLNVYLPPNPRGGANPQFDHSKRPFQGSRDRIGFLVLRILSCLLMCGTVLLTGLASRRLLPLGHVWLLGPIVVAMLPQFAYIGSSISNDVLVAFAGAGVTWAAVRLADEPAQRRHWLSLGLWLGVAVLSKKSALCLVPAAALLVGTICLRDRAQSRAFLKHAFVAFAACLLLCLPVLARNFLVYRDPLGNRMEVETLSSLVYPQPLGSRHFRFLFPDIVPRSFVAHFGWMIVEVKQKYVWPVVRGMLIMAGLSVGAFEVPKLRAAAVFCWSAFVLNVVGLVYYNLLFPQAQGRLLFASLASLGLLCALGGHEVSRRVKLPYKWVALVPIFVWLLWFDYLCVLTNSNFYTGPPW